MSDTAADAPIGSPSSHQSNLVCLGGRPASVFDGSTRYGFKVVPRVEMKAAFGALGPPGWGRAPGRVDEVIEAVLVEGVGARQCAADVPYFDGVHANEALL